MEAQSFEGFEVCVGTAAAVALKSFAQGVAPESGGPPVVPPEREGFGRTVVTRSLQYSDGGAEFEFNASGVVCRMSIPSEDLDLG